MRIGLLGGSFNPAHRGHLKIAYSALKFLQLDQVWLLVSPGNPLKMKNPITPFSERFVSAEKLADGKRIIATDWEARLKEHYTWRTMQHLKKRFPYVQFIWLMGSDGFANFTQWKHWKQIAKSMPIAIFPRPCSVIPALKGKASNVLRHYRHETRQLARLPNKMKLPYWTFLTISQDPISSTVIRESGHKNII